MMRIASARRWSTSLIIWSPFSNSAFTKLPEWHWLHVFTILSRSFCQSSCLSRATSAAFTTSSLAVGFPSGSSTPRACRMVTWSVAHCLSSGNGKRTARNPQDVLTSWLPSCMWQVWHVGAATVSGSVLFCFNRYRTPCLEAEYISHCGWSKPIWQVWQACGCRASWTEKVCRVWHASHEATPNPAPFLFNSFISFSVFTPILWHPPQPFIPSVKAIGSQCVVGIAFMAAHARACFPFLNCSAWSSWQPAQVSGVGMLTFATSWGDLCWSPWQTEQSISFWLCLLSCQSVTMLGVTFLWQSKHTWAEVLEAKAILNAKMISALYILIHPPYFVSNGFSSRPI